MATLDSRINASDLMHDSTMVVHVCVVYDWRWRVGLWLVRLGVRVMGARCKVIRS
jgi:hypothetical protein